MEIASTLTFVSPIHFAMNLWMKRTITEKNGGQPNEEGDAKHIKQILYEKGYCPM